MSSCSLTIIAHRLSAELKFSGMISTVGIVVSYYSSNSATREIIDSESRW